jgi:hypothetical protein
LDVFDKSRQKRQRQFVETIEVVRRADVVDMVKERIPEDENTIISNTKFGQLFHWTNLTQSNKIKTRPLKLLSATEIIFCVCRPTS